MISKHVIQVAPSILAGDFGHLAQEAQRVEQAGADCLHVDIMDGHFVPNLTMGFKALAALNRATDLFMDVHIMVYHPFELVERLVEAGADRITFHFEATEEVSEALEYIRRCGVQAGLAFRPETSGEFVVKYLTQCDLILLMTVSPGFGGQAFMPEVLDKIRFVRTACQQRKIRARGQIISNFKDAEEFLIQVDGGIDATTAPLCVQAGANVLVAGTYLFKGEGEMSEKIQQLRHCL